HIPESSAAMVATMADRVKAIKIRLDRGLWPPIKAKLSGVSRAPAHDQKEAGLIRIPLQIYHLYLIEGAVSLAHGSKHKRKHEAVES
ncbi:6496_t:CDS:2, partial [Racocetra fulgida]